MAYKKDLQDAAQKVMDDLGPYHKEQVYEEAIMHEFRCCGIPYERQRNIEIIYKGYTVGTKRPDCIVSLSNENGNEFLVEMKALAAIRPQNIRQVKVYLASLNIERGAVLNFNTHTGKIDFKDVLKPKLTFTKKVATPHKKCEGNIEKILKEGGKEVINYLGTGFFFDYSGVKLYTEALGVELRLQGLKFSSVTYAVCYESHHVADYTYDFVFCSGEVVKICAYDNKDQIKPFADELKVYNDQFGITKGFLLVFPKNDKLKVQVKPMGIKITKK